MSTTETAAAAATPAPKAKPNKLTTQQSFKLLRWMENNDPDVRISADTKLAEQASNDLGFIVTVSNFSNAREAAGIEKIEPEKPKTLEDRVQALENQLGVQRSILAALAAGMIKLMPDEPANPILAAAKADEHKTCTEPPSAELGLPGLG